MTAAGKLIIAERALEAIIKARASNSFRELDHAIDAATIVYDDIGRWSRRPADVVPIKVSAS